MRGNVAKDGVGESVLKIDKDLHAEREWIDAYVHLVVEVCNWYDVTVESIAMCPSRMKGIHFYISLTQPVPPKTALLFMWLLGDDCRRLDFNRARVETALLEWNKLFEGPSTRLRTLYKKSNGNRAKAPITWRHYPANNSVAGKSGITRNKPKTSVMIPWSLRKRTVNTPKNHHTERR